ncbi:MAG: glycosyltransferase family 2 protein [Acidobacteriia bacterium]|nr:glycosyltransferase family 2 protein [Terriglobia bacterium]
MSFSPTVEPAPEVSVLMPAYNVTQYIGGALDSVFSQTFEHFEVIVVNDGCPDTAALERVLRPYQSRIRYIAQSNRGVSGARNTAARAAHAPLILHLDPDDLLEPFCLEQQVQTMREHAEYDAVYCNSSMFGEGPLAGRCWMDVYPSAGPVSFASVLRSRTCPANPGSIIRRAALERIGFYDETLRSWEDYDVWLRILKSSPPGRIAFQTRPLARYRVRGDSLTYQSRYMEYALAVLEKAARDFELSSEEADALRDRTELVRHEVENSRGKRALRERRWKDAIRSFEYCHRYQPSRKTEAALLLLRTAPWALSPLIRMWDSYLEKRADSRTPGK